MVNSQQFATRLQKIIDYYDLSAAGFAEAIKVGRSSVSHIISGRNKPSLDFVLKVVHTFPEVELYWLLNGKGNFPSSDTKEKAPYTATPEIAKTSTKTLPEDKTKVAGSDPTPDKAGKIKRIVIFYEDGSFETFQN